MTSSNCQFTKTERYIPVLAISKSYSNFDIYSKRVPQINHTFYKINFMLHILKYMCSCHVAFRIKYFARLNSTGSYNILSRFKYCIVVG